jgi:hypothetical protein
MLALSITNVLHNHADIVHVLNHGSSDQTAHGLKVLKEIWGERLKIYSTSPDLPFEQSLLTNMISSIAEDEGADWIYVFDSDEFLLSKRNFSLREELLKLSNEIVGIRYSLNNYISTYDFDENNLNCYKKLIYRSKPNVEYDPLHAMELISRGELSFFDLPFPSKIIFRANKNLLVNTGAHRLQYTFDTQSIVNLIEAECAHLSLISKNMLARKSMLGKHWIDNGFPARIGWQNQLVHQLDVLGKLDWFWERHSIQPENSETANPDHIIDESLVECLNNSIEILKEKFGGINLSMLSDFPLKSGYDNETKFTFDHAFQMVSFFNKKIASLLNVKKHK